MGLISYVNIANLSVISYFIFAGLMMKSKASYRLGKLSTNELHQQLLESSRLF